MDLEKMTLKQMREFADKAEVSIPENLKTKDDILAYLKEPKPTEPPEQPKGPTPEQIQDDRDKKASKVPLSESDKARLAGLEKLARSGRSPNIDQMKDLRILRERKKITPLSVVEQKELDELTLKEQGNPIDGSNISGLPDDERLSELRKRSEI